MRFLITAGATREYLDSVRFLSNASSGKMGYACAEAARERGHEVVLVSGPVSLESPNGVKRISVVSAEEMAQAVLKEFSRSRCDCVIMAAAVCDYRPRKRYSQKRPKGSGTLKLELEPTQDILAELGRRKEGQVLIGFALQDRACRSRARSKLKAKNLDAIVLNEPEAMEAGSSRIEILVRDGGWRSYSRASKGVSAGRIVRLAERMYLKGQSG